MANREVPDCDRTHGDLGERVLDEVEHLSVRLEVPHGEGLIGALLGLALYRLLQVVLFSHRLHLEVREATHITPSCPSVRGRVQTATVKKQRWTSSTILSCIPVHAAGSVGLFWFTSFPPSTAASTATASSSLRSTDVLCLHNKTRPSQSRLCRPAADPLSATLVQETLPVHLLEGASFHSSAIPASSCSQGRRTPAV